MNVSEIRREIKELRNSLLYKYEPGFKAFMMGAKDNPTEAEIEAYRKDYLHTSIVVITLKDCGKRWD